MAATARGRLRVVLLVLCSVGSDAWSGTCWCPASPLPAVTHRWQRRAMSCCAPSAGKRSAPASEIGPELIPPCWDAHNHLQLSRRDTDIQKLVEERSLVVSLMGTQPDDWQHTQELTARLPAKIRPNFGLHPWWAHDYESPEPDSGWMLELRAALESDPSSCLGEIGLDGQWVPPGLQEVQYEQQMDAFRQQLQLAVDLNRPVSLHCVKAYGDMFDILRTAPALPPAVYMHSWGGKIGMLESYVKMKKFGDRFYFGFSSFANLRQNCHKTSAVIAAVPDDRLLLESDLEDPSDVPEALHQMLHVMAEAKGWSVEETARITMRNAERFYSAGLPEKDSVKDPEQELHSLGRKHSL